MPKNLKLGGAGIRSSPSLILRFLTIGVDQLSGGGPADRVWAEDDEADDMDDVAQI